MVYSTYARASSGPYGPPASGLPGPPGLVTPRPGPMNPASPILSPGYAGSPALFAPPPPPAGRGPYGTPEALQLRCCGADTSCDCESENYRPGMELDMTYQGNGQGEYILKTSYEYVGRGAGDFSVHARPERAYIGYVAGGCCCVLVLLPLAWLLLSSVLSTEALLRPEARASALHGQEAAAARRTPRGKCVIWGDPHAKVFDNRVDMSPTVTFLNNGDYWLVRSDKVLIQGRLEASEWKNGIASLHGLALGGPFMKNNTLLIGPIAGKVYYNNREILAAEPDAFSVPGVLSASNHDQRVRLDDGTQTHVHVVDLLLQESVHVVVHRWDGHLDVVINMNQLQQQDGYCGNFNGVQTDDALQKIRSRFPGQVLPNELLFPATTFNQGTAKAKTMSDCKPEVLALAKKTCVDLNRHAGGAIIDACLFDVCFQGAQYAVEDAATVQAAR